jgi:hypothetical protein
MRNLTQALDMNEAEIARELGVTTRTVRAWIAGVRRPIERNRAALAALVSRVHAEHSAATHRWSATRDRALCATKLDLSTAAQRAAHTAWVAEINRQFAAPAPVAAPADDLLALLAV